jgi:immune inhibitor A
VVLVYFQDQKMSPNAEKDMQDLFFSKKTRKNGSLNDYLCEVSGGIITAVQGHIYGPYELPQKMTWYANGQNGMDTAKDAPSLKTMADHTVSILEQKGVNLKQYDHKHRAPGWVDTLVIVHAGKDAGGSTTESKDDLWSCKWSLDSARSINKGTEKEVKISPFMTIPDTAQLGVAAHEFGHLAFGWPDLYDISREDPGRGIGYWCLMGMGSWGGNPRGTYPPHPSAWCKVQQGWVNVIEDNVNGSISINEAEAVLQKMKGSGVNPNLGTVRKLWSNGETLGDEYFLVENRQKVGYDKFLPGEGLFGTCCFEFLES